MEYIASGPHRIPWVIDTKETPEMSLRINDVTVDSPFKSRYANYIGGEWSAPADGNYFENTTPITGKVLCEIPRSNDKDVNHALDAAHRAKTAWGKTSATERANILNKIADRVEA